MLRKLNLLGACVVLALAGTPALAEGNVNFSLGERSFTENDLEPVDDQTFLGVYADFAVSDWPVDLAGGIYRSTDHDSAGGIDVRATITEVSFGAMKTWTFLGNMHPFAGGGLAVVQVEAEIDYGFTSEEEDDIAGAAYAEGGIYWTLGKVFNLGAHVRVSKGSGHDIAGSDIDSDYVQAGLLAGFGWGTR